MPRKNYRIQLIVTEWNTTKTTLTTSFKARNNRPRWSQNDWRFKPLIAWRVWLVGLDWYWIMTTAWWLISENIHREIPNEVIGTRYCQFVPRDRLVDWKEGRRSEYPLILHFQKTWRHLPSIESMVSSKRRNSLCSQFCVVLCSIINRFLCCHFFWAPRL